MLGAGLRDSEGGVDDIGEDEGGSEADDDSDVEESEREGGVLEQGIKLRWSEVSGLLLCTGTTRINQNHYDTLRW